MNAAASITLLAGLLLAPAAAAAAPIPIDEPARIAAFDQHLNRSMPTDLQFRDESGRTVRLADYLAGAPAVLVFAYYGCSSLCPTVIANLVHRLDAAALPPAEAPQIVVVSIDPLDSPALAARSKAHYIATLGAQGGGAAARLHLLTGDDAAITLIADAAGFHYAYDSATQQYAHAAGIVLLTPQGRIARYFFGFSYSPQELADALHEAAARRIASPVERLLLLCFHYDPATGRYSATVLSALQALALATMLGLVLVAVYRRHRSAGARVPQGR